MFLWGTINHLAMVTTFIIDTSLGHGNWCWSGTYDGNTYVNEEETGKYYLATDGNVYFVSDYDTVDTLTSGATTSTPDFVDGDDVVGGTRGDDVIDKYYVDSDGDTIAGGAGDDLIYGDQGGNVESENAITIDNQNFDDTDKGFTVEVQNIEGGALTAASVDNIEETSIGLGAGTAQRRARASRRTKPGFCGLGDCKF